MVWVFVEKLVLFCDKLDMAIIILYSYKKLAETLDEPQVIVPRPSLLLLCINCTYFSDVIGSVWWLSSSGKLWCLVVYGSSIDLDLIQLSLDVSFVASVNSVFILCILYLIVFVQRCTLQRLLLDKNTMQIYLNQCQIVVTNIVVISLSIAKGQPKFN